MLITVSTRRKRPRKDISRMSVASQSPFPQNQLNAMNPDVPSPQALSSAASSSIINLDQLVALLVKPESELISITRNSFSLPSSFTVSDNSGGGGRIIPISYSVLRYASSLYRNISEKAVGPTVGLIFPCTYVFC